MANGLNTLAYDAGTGVMSFTGAFSAGSVAITKITVVGEGGGSYTLTGLTSGTTISVTSSGSQTLTGTLNATDRLNVGGLFNNSNTATTPFVTTNHTAADGTQYNITWLTGTFPGVNASSSQKTVTVSNVAAPTISAASYDAATHVLSVTGSSMVARVGASNDIDPTKLTITGQGGASYTLTTDTSKVEVTSATGFSVTLAGADITGVANLVNKAGTSAINGTAYTLSAADDWNGDVTGGNIAVAAITLTASGLPPATTIATQGFLADTGSSNSDFITKTAAQTISGTTSAALAAGEFVEVSLNNGGTWTTATSTVAQSNWSLANQTLTGSDTLRVRVSNADGGGTATSQAYALDTTAPTLGITSDKSALKVGETASITFTFSEDPGNTFTWDGASGSVVVSGGTLSAIGGTGLTRTATFIPTAGTNSGTASIIVAAGNYQDTAGNDGGAGTTPALTFDTLAPPAPPPPTLATASDSGASSSDGITNATTPTISGSGAEANATIKVYDTDNSTVLLTTTANGSGVWGAALTTALTQGDHTLTARATDTAGNQGAVSTGLALTVDTTAPAFASATVSGNTLVLTYAEALDAVNKPGTGAFTVMVGGTADAVTGVVINSAAKTVTLALATAAASGQAVTVAYTDPTGTSTTHDVAGNNAATLAATAVTNNTPAATPPTGAPSALAPGSTLTTPATGGSATGTAGNDTFTAGGGNSVFILGGGNDTVYGATGANALTTVVAGRNRSEYTISHTADGTFTVKGTDGSVATLQNVQRIAFGDVTIAIDPTSATGRVAEFYKTALGRAPEGNGLDYYLSSQGAGNTLQVAQGFIASAEFTARYGSLGDTVFIAQMYANAFGRTPDAGGLAYYQDMLTHASSASQGRALLLAGFMDSAEMATKLVGVVDQGTPLLG